MAVGASGGGHDVRRPRIPAIARDLRPLVFLDKDGTLVRDVPYSVDPSRIELMPRAGEALRALQAAGFGLAVVSNQSGVARGLFEEAALEPYRRRLDEILAAEGVRLDAFEYCPHHPEGMNDYRAACACRKPEPGLLLRVAARLRGDLLRSWMVGDILDDVEAGHRAGCRSILVDSGHETEWLSGPGRGPDLVVDDLPSAARAILAAHAADRVAPAEVAG